MKKINYKKSNGITLVALIAIIIIPIIFASVGIYFLLKNNKEISEESDENINENGESKSIIKYVEVQDDGNAIVLKDTGELYEVTYKGEAYKYVKFEESNSKIVARNVKNYNKWYYLTSSNILYRYDSENVIVHNEKEQIVNNVKEFYGYGLYLTKTNSLYSYNNKIADNVKKYYENGYYLTKTNDLYNIYSNNEKIASNVKEYKEGYYITLSNELYRCGKYSKVIPRKIANDVKEYCGDGYYITISNELYCYDEYNHYDFEISGKIADNIKKYCGDNYYLTIEDELYEYDGKISRIIANDVKKYYEKGYYLTKANELYINHSRKANYDEKLEKIADNVKEYYEQDYYLTNTGELYKHTYTSQSDELIASGVTNVGYNANWYETKNEEIYLEFLPKLQMCPPDFY